MTLFNGSPSFKDPTALFVLMQQRAAEMAARLTVQQTAATGIGGAPATAIATALGLELTRLAGWGVNPSDPMPT